MRQKATALLANTRGGRGRALTVLVPKERATPRMPPAPTGMPWGRMTRALWRSFWRSPVSVAVDLNADAERLYRWLEAVEERERLLASVREDGYAPARKVLAEMDTDEGKVIVLLAGAHPSLAYIKHLDREIAKLSEHFGMTPLSRFRLQLTFAEAGKAKQSLARAHARESNEQEVIDLNALG